MPRVSVIIATYNRPHLLPRAVRSAKAAGDDVEVVVVDDSSSDETLELCRGMTGIRYVRTERNLRMSGARNLGISESTSEYLAFLDDDDVRLPGSLDAQADLLDSSPEAGFVYGQALYGDADCAPTGGLWPDSCPRGDVFWELMAWNFVPCLSVVFRRSCLDRVGPLDESISGVDDWDLWLRIAERHGVAAVERPVAVWRRSAPASGQYSSRPDAMLALSARLLRRRWLALPRAASAPRQVRDEAGRRFFERVSDQLVWETARSLKGGHAVQAWRNVWAAARVCPRLALRKGLRAKSLRFLAGRVAGAPSPTAGPHGGSEE